MKTKPRARRMWANYYPKIVCVHHTRKSAGANSDPSYPHAVPVAVIPLDNPEALISRACYVVDNMILTATIGEVVRAVLVSSGVLPRTRKGGRK